MLVGTSEPWGESPADWEESSLVEARKKDLSLLSSDFGAPFSNHTRGRVHGMTGDGLYFSGVHTSTLQPSIDQLAVRYLARPDQIPSLELGLLMERDSVLHRLQRA